jgi:hypothetical protein
LGGGLGVILGLIEGEIRKDWPLLSVFVGTISLLGVLIGAPRRA